MNVNLVFLNEPHINTDVYKKSMQNQIQIKLDTGNKATDEFINNIIDALNKYTIDLAKSQIRISFEQSEKEVIDLHKRTSQGIETARKNGKQIGRKAGSKIETKKSKEMKIKIQKMANDFDGNMSDKEVIETLKIARNTYFKYKRELRHSLYED